MNVFLRKLRTLPRRTTPVTTDMLHLYAPATGKDHYVLLSDLIAGGGYPDWDAAATYAINNTVTYGLRLWKSLQSANTGHTPTEGAWWTEVSASPAAPWALTGISTLTGVATIRSSAPNQHVFDGTWTATANNQYHMNFAGSFTSRNINNDSLYGYQFTPTLAVNAGAPTGQILTGVFINPTFSGSGTFYPLQVQNAGSDLFKIQSTGIVSTTGNVRVGTYVEISGSLSRINVWQGGDGVGLDVYNNNNSNFLFSFNNSIGNSSIVDMYMNPSVTTGTVTNASTQISSKSFQYQTRLYNGSTEIKGWSSLKDVASTTINSDHDLTLYVSTGPSPLFSTPILKINSTYGQFGIFVPGGANPYLTMSHSLGVATNFHITQGGGGWSYRFYDNTSYESIKTGTLGTLAFTINSTIVTAEGDFRAKGKVLTGTQVHGIAGEVSVGLLVGAVTGGSGNVVKFVDNAIVVMMQVATGSLGLVNNQYLAWNTTATGPTTSPTILQADGADTYSLFAADSGTPSTSLKLLLYRVGQRGSVTNYERGKFGFNSGSLEIGTEKGGTGAGRSIKFISSLQASFFINDDVKIDMTAGSSSRFVVLDSTFSFMIDTNHNTTWTYPNDKTQMDSSGNFNRTKGNTSASADWFLTAATGISGATRGQNLVIQAGAAYQTSGNNDAGDVNIGTQGKLGSGVEGSVNVQIKPGGRLGFFNVTGVVQQISGENLTNNVTSGGTTGTIADFTSLTTYATDAAAIRNDIYQLARKLKQVNDALRLYGMLT